MTAALWADTREIPPKPRGVSRVERRERKAGKEAACYAEMEMEHFYYSFLHEFPGPWLDSSIIGYCLFCNFEGIGNSWRCPRCGHELLWRDVYFHQPFEPYLVFNEDTGEWYLNKQRGRPEYPWGEP